MNKYTSVVSLVVATTFLILCNSSARAQDLDCDYFQNVVLGQTYYVYSPNYPNSYPRGKTCRWQAQCPANTRCRLACSDISLPSTTGCTGDRLLVSKTGDSQLTGADKYCGAGTLNVYSTSNRLSVGLITTTTSTGGKFYCTLTAESYTPPSTCDCGWKSQRRIVGGTETRINEFPMMVALLDVSLRSVYCGATIISTRYVATAAHCLVNQAVSNVGVLYGEHNIKLSDSPATTLIRASQFIRHPQYDGNFDNDIGLILTDVAIVFSDLVGPACLPFKFSSNLLTNYPVEALGWGTQSFGGVDSDYLQKVSLGVVEQNSCRNTLGAVVNSRVLCTYASGKDTCQHDSGGPLLYLDPSNGREYLVGIIIGGYGCATSRPALNSRITSHIQWIQANTPGVTYCNK